MLPTPFSLCCLHALRFQVDNSSLSEEELVRPVDGARLHAFESSVDQEPAMNPSDSAAEALPGMPCPEPSQAVPAAEAAVTAAIVADHVAAMVACEGGGPRASGQHARHPLRALHTLRTLISVPH